jgi:hypothetical protein
MPTTGEAHLWPADRLRGRSHPAPVYLVAGHHRTARFGPDADWASSSSRRRQVVTGCQLRDGSFSRIARYMRMIGLTISGDAYAVIASILPPARVDRDIVPDGEYQIWLPQAVVVRLLALRERGETFSEVILRLAERGSVAAILRELPGTTAMKDSSSRPR